MDHDTKPGGGRLAVLGALIAMYATSPGQTFVLSSFNGPLSEGLGLSETRLAGAYLVGTLLSAALLTHAGKLADRLGPRHMIALAGCGLGLAGAGLANVQGLVGLTLAFFALRFFGQGVLSMASSHALALRFDARLGSVEGLRGGTVSLAIATAPLIAVALADAFGWRNAAWMLCACAASLALLAAYALLDPDPARGPSSGPKDQSSGGGMTLAEARRTAPFWVLLGATAFTAMALTAVHFHLQPILAVHGIGKLDAASTFVPFALSGLVATLVGGLLVDRLAAPWVLAPGVLAVGLGTALVGASASLLAAHLGMGVLGLGHGLVMAVSAPTLARYFGRAHHGAIRGASGTAAVAGSAAGPYALSALASPLGGYDGALFAAAALALPLSVAATRLRAPSPIPDPAR